MVTRREESQTASLEPVVLVADEEKCIRSLLRDCLEDNGYRVIEADSVRCALGIVDASQEPLVLIMSNSDLPDHTSREFFTAIATDPATRQAYVYPTSVPVRTKLRQLVELSTTEKTPPVPRPSELVALLTVVSTAVARLRPDDDNTAG
jgi:response regulator RpfG family c-di-GMP phosphodiesterase